MSQYRVEMRTPSGMWIPAYYPNYCVAMAADSLREAYEIAETVKLHWDAPQIDAPTDYRIVKKEVSQ